MRNIMRAKSLKMSLYLYLKANTVVSINKLDDLVNRLGYKIDNGTRRLRELRRAKLISKIDDGKSIVAYKFIK